MKGNLIIYYLRIQRLYYHTVSLFIHVLAWTGDYSELLCTVIKSALWYSYLATEAEQFMMQNFSLPVVGGSLGACDPAFLLP